jgi:fatty-acyl-CoA synthase
LRPLDFFEVAASAYRDRVALVDGGVQRSYAQVDLTTRRLARALRDCGVADEDRVALYSWSDARVLPCMVAVMRAGGVLVPINAALSADSVVAFLKVVKPRSLVYHPRARAAVDRIRSAVGGIASVLSLDEAAGEGWRAGPSTDEDALPDWGDSCGNAQRIVTIVQTGGTTGTAKGVTIRTAAYTSYIEAYRRFLHFDDDEPVCLTTSQLTPAALGMIFVMSTLGARHIVMPTFSASAALDSIERHRVTHLWLPATGLHALLEHPRLHRCDLASVRAVIVGGSAVARADLAKAVETFGPCVRHSYGQVETGILAWLDERTIARAVAGDHPERLGSCGRINEAMRVAIVDGRGTLAPPGVVGEVVARGRGVSDYVDDPELTAATRRSGWHHTGDLGYIDADGFLFLVGRLKDVILTGGATVYAAEVEATLLELASVEECAVVGTPDALLGEVVTAVIAPRTPEPPSAADIGAYCRLRLGGVKSPKRIEFWRQMPKTAAGKIDKRAIRVALQDVVTPRASQAC